VIGIGDTIVKNFVVSQSNKQVALDGAAIASQPRPKHQQPVQTKKIKQESRSHPSTMHRPL
jgi:hypothetical protein